MRVIIVEDEQRARRGLKNIITTISAEHEIIAEAADGKSGLEVIKTLKPDLVFTDVKMPFMNGIELIEEARRCGIKSKFVIVTAYEEFDIARRAISNGVSAYLVKPIMMEDVEEIFEQLGKKKEENQVEAKGELVKDYPNAHPIIKKALQLIEENFASRMSQKELAETLCISPEYFSYLFAREVGENFAKFLKNYRIEAAKNLLLKSDMAKEEIPYQVGFSDYKYFSKVFRESEGMGISEFIRRNRMNLE